MMIPPGKKKKTAFQWLESVTEYRVTESDVQTMSPATTEQNNHACRRQQVTEMMLILCDFFKSGAVEDGGHGSVEMARQKWLSLCNE